MADLQKLAHNMSSKMIKNGANTQDLKHYFLHSYQIYEQLFTLIRSEASYYTKPEPLRHPLIFYYGHTACFYINKLYDKGLIPERLNPNFQSIFAVGVDEMDWDDLDETHYNWPCLKDVRIYRQKVKQIVLDVIEKIDHEISWESDAWIIMMGIEHEKIHLETSSVIIRRLPIQQIVPSDVLIDCPFTQLCPQDILQNELKQVKIRDLKWQRGNKMKTNYYGWDNEFGNKSIKVAPFKASTMLVSNKEFLQFVQDQGYLRKQLWDKEGQQWLLSTKTTKPIFWVKNDSTYKLRTMNKIIDLPLDWPVEVNNLEATAFCKWKSLKTNKKLRLPTEDQYMQLRQYIEEDLFDWKHGEIGNINMEGWFSPSPVNYYENKGFYDIIGNVWQHCSTPIYPFEDFEIHPIYEDFTTPTFDGRHFMIKGGSFVSCGNQALKYSRYAFRRHFYQFAGFRYVESEVDPELPHVLKDECDQKVHDNLKIHYLSDTSYITEAVRLISEKCSFPEHKFLHVGCSAGRVVLEMSKNFQKSYGSDFSARFFQMATRMIEKGELSYKEIKISNESIQPILSNIVLYQMNPENPDHNKLNGFKVIFIDGMILKPDSIKRVLSKFFPTMLQNSYLLTSSTQTRNKIDVEDVKKIDMSASLIAEMDTPLGLQNGSQEKVRLSLFGMKK